MMPISSTAPISAFSPGLAKKAVMICLYSTTSSSAHSTRNTSIRTRKIRGEDSLLSSISIAEREEGPDAIGLIVTCCGGNTFGPPIWHSGAGKKGQLRSVAGGTWNFGAKPGLDSCLVHELSVP